MAVSKTKGRERALLLVSTGGKYLFFLWFGEFGAADIASIGDKRYFLFADTLDFAMPYALLTRTPRDLETISKRSLIFFNREFGVNYVGRY